MLCVSYISVKLGRGEMCFARRLFLIPNAGIIKESAIFITAEISHSILKKKIERMVGHNHKDFSVTHCTVSVITLSLRFVLPALNPFFPPRRGII